MSRLTAEEALSHPYVAQFHSAADEPSAAGPVSISVDDNVKVQPESRRYRLCRSPGTGACMVLAMGQTYIWAPAALNP